MNQTPHNPGQDAAEPVDPVSIARTQHPPITAGDVVSPAYSSNWPVMIGVISMVLGALGALNALGTGCWAFFGPAFLESMGAANNPQVAMNLQTMRDFKELILVNTSVSLVLASLLVFAGARLARRRRSGVVWSKRWAILKLVFAIAGSALGAVMSTSQMAATNQQLSVQGAPAFVKVVVSASPIIGVAFSLIWFSAYPVFMLIWFRRATVKQTVAPWSR